MAGLQRFITYINKYENDEKTDSAGFAKIEIRSGICRMEVHIRNGNIENMQATVYIFAKKEAIIHGIPVGSMEIARGSSDVRYAFDTKEIQSYGLTMEDMQGIWIPLDENSFLASQWKEGKISKEQFHIMEKEEPPAPKEQAPKMQPQKESHPQKTAEPKTVPSGGPAGKGAAETEEALNQENKSPNERDTRGMEDAVSNPVKTADNPEEVGRKEDDATEQKILKEERGEDRNLRATELPLEEFFEGRGWGAVYRKLRLKCGVYFPFEGREIECIRMSLNDLREFPQKYWYLGKNSFLLHGFFNYRHILFGEMERGGKNEYFIGVPGVYQNQERIMASLFGFPEVCTARNSEYKTGNFGYWYRII